MAILLIFICTLTILVSLGFLGVALMLYFLGRQTYGIRPAGEWTIILLSLFAGGAGAVLGSMGFLRMLASIH